MNNFNPYAMQRPMLGMAQAEQYGRRPFLHPMQTGGNLPPQQMPQMHTGGPLPPQGYDSSGINPGGMYTGGNYPPMRLARMAGNGPSQGFGNRLGGLLR